MKINSSALVMTAAFIISMVALCGCDKEDDSTNPLTNAAAPDCTNLIIRDVSLSGNLIEVTLENTCKSCEDGWIYLGMVMIDKTTSIPDTLAQTECLVCHPCPRNGQSRTYQLTTNLTTLPPLNDVQFAFSNLCSDLTYAEK
jgi:hypothetical protein